MVSFNGIFENIIAELIVVAFSFLISKFFPYLISKKEKVSVSKNFDFLKLAVFLTTISILNLILNLSFWDNNNLTILLTLLSIGFGFSTYYIYENQCPACKKFIRAKKKIDEKIIKEYEKRIPYQPLKIYKYSNGKIWKKEPFGERKNRIEKWQTKQKFYECNYCKHQWDSGQVEEPSFIEKESHKVENTGKRDPSEFSY